MTARTVRDVLVEHLGPDVADVLAELRKVLSTGDQYVSRELPAGQLTDGDVIRDKTGALWMVGRVEGEDSLEVTITRGSATKTAYLVPGRPIPVLLTRTDARALAILESELGAVTVERKVA